MKKNNLHRALNLWVPLVLAISLGVFLITLLVAPVSKLFIAIAIALGAIDSITTMEELTGGKELKWISLPVVIVGDFVATAASFEGTTWAETWVLSIQFLSIVVFAEAVIIVLLRSRLEAFYARRKPRPPGGDVQQFVGPERR